MKYDVNEFCLIFLCDIPFESHNYSMSSEYGYHRVIAW